MTPPDPPAAVALFWTGIAFLAICAYRKPKPAAPKVSPNSFRSQPMEA